MLATACSLETSGLSPTGGRTTTGTSRPSVDSGTEPAPDAHVDAEPTQEPDAAGLQDAAPPGCQLAGRHAIQVQSVVTWEAKPLLGFLPVPVIDEGRGQLNMTVRVDFDQDGNVLEGGLQACDAEVPAFVSSPFPDWEEHYLAYFDETIWDAPGMPSVPVSMELDCLEPGCDLHVNPVHVLLGVQRGNPAAPWPRDRSALQYVDHDGDAVPGVAVEMQGPSMPPYNYPPVTPDLSQRAKRIMLGIGVVAELSGQLDSCEQVSGTAPTLTVDTHAVHCVTSDLASTRCTEEQSAFVDDNLPRWVTESATFRSVRVDESATCADVRAAIAALDAP